jgi:hypothetical protein
MRGSNEASNRFNACIAVSQWLQKDIEDSHRAEWKKLHQQQELRAKVKKLQQEQELYKDEHEQHKAVKHDCKIGRSGGNARPDGEMGR